MERLHFASDYQEGAHPEVLDKLVKTNMESTSGYGTDPYCEEAREKIREACNCPDAAVHFFIGGTQINSVTIKTLLAPYEGVIAASTGHVSVHESGAIEMGGHKVLELPPEEGGKLNAEAVRKYCEIFWSDENRDNIVMPGMVYISQPTEYGAIYSLAEMEELRKVCDEYKLRFFVDGARLAYALASEENDVTLPDLARLADAFYFGGTKCGLLFGEALIVPDGSKIPHFYSVMKQNGAVLAKGRILGVQFGALFTDKLYERVGKPAVDAANFIRKGLVEKGYRLFMPSPTNQVFVIMENEKLPALGEKVEYGFFERYDDDHTVIRFCPCWSTTMEKAEALMALL